MEMFKKFYSTIMRFYKSNLLVSIFVSVSVGIVIAYQLSYNLPEWYPGAGRHFTVLYNIAMAIIGSFAFYVILDYIPKERKNKAVRFWVLMEYSKMIESIDLLFEDLSELYVGERKKSIFCTQEDIKQIADKLKTSDKVSTQLLFKSNMTVFEALERCKNMVNEAVNTVISNFSEVLSAKEIEVLSKLAYGKMYNFLNGTNCLYTLTDLSGDTDKEKFYAFSEYRLLVCDLLHLSTQMIQN